MKPQSTRTRQKSVPERLDLDPPAAATKGSSRKPP
jgi:hypothetical protein